MSEIKLKPCRSAAVKQNCFMIIWAGLWLNVRFVEMELFILRNRMVRLMHGTGGLAMNKLKSCPFCGGKAEIFRWQAHITDEYHSDLVCTNCGAGFHDVSSEKSAFKAWNKRFANAALVHAHWKGYHTQEPYCSNCGFTYDHEQGENAQITDYCGNCGAKMGENEVENLKRCSCGASECPDVEKKRKGQMVYTLPLYFNLRKDCVGRHHRRSGECMEWSPERWC